MFWAPLELYQPSCSYWSYPLKPISIDHLLLHFHNMASRCILFHFVLLQLPLVIARGHITLWMIQFMEAQIIGYIGPVGLTKFVCKTWFYTDSLTGLWKWWCSLNKTESLQRFIMMWLPTKCATDSDVPCHSRWSVTSQLVQKCVFLTDNSIKSLAATDPPK